MPSYLNLDGITVEYQSNFWDGSAKLVLPGDEMSFAKKFPPDVGPNAPEIVNKNGIFLNAFAEKIVQELMASRGEVATGSADGIAEGFAANEAERKRKQVEEALSKRKPARSRQGGGPVEL